MMRPVKSHPLLALSLLFAGAVVGQTNSPHLVCDSPTHDFGSVIDVPVITHTWTLHNKGGTDLIVDRVQTSCGCTTTRMDNQVIPPGGSSDLTASLSLKGRKGPQHKTVTVHSNDPRQARFVLTFKGDSKQGVMAMPQSVILGPGSIGKPIVHVRVYSDPSLPFRIQRLETTGGAFFSADLLTITSNSAYQVDVALVATNMSTDRTNGTLIVHTDHPSYPSIKIPVIAFAQRDFSLTPRELVIWDPGAQSKPVTRYFFLRSGTSAPFTIDRVDPPGDAAKVDIMPLGVGRYRIVLNNVSPAQAAEQGEFTIHLRQADGTPEQISVPVRTATPP